MKEKTIQDGWSLLMKFGSEENLKKLQAGQFYMKNLKPLAIGFVAGAACMVSTVAIAASNEVTAQLFNDAFFNINGEIVATP